MININPHNLGNYIVPRDTKNGICVDIGCNVGSFTKKYCNHFSKIFYYEPFIECFNICQAFSKNYDHIKGYNLAAWSKSGSTVNILAHENKDSGSSAIESASLNNEWSKKNIVHSVATISLEDILIKCGGSITYCKSDCETSEYYIFLGKDLMNIMYIGMEIHHQMGQEKQLELINYILKTHDLIYGSLRYTPFNREILFRRKT